MDRLIISRFSSILLPNIEDIRNNFLDTYVLNTRDVDTHNLDLVKNSFSILVHNICSGNIDGSIAAAKDLASSNIELSIPYVILIHELIHLHKLLIDFLIEKDCRDEVYELHKLNSKLEDIIAEVYLYNYIDTLLSKNNVRLNNLNDIYEKNIVQYYKSHLKWLSNLVHCVKNECNDNFPQIDHNLCSFGVWLSRDGKDIIQNNSKYLDIVKQHKNLHIIASKIKNDISKKEIEFHIVLTYLEKCEMISLSLGTELALVDNTLINSKASKDPLTGALNRQRLGQLYLNQLEISFATSQAFVLAICDLDYFKKVNDTYGHIAGDKVLKGFVNLSKKHLRSSDMVIRYGGEEFVFIMPSVKFETANEILNKLRENFENTIVEFEDNKISTTVSIGMIQIDPENHNLDLSNIEDAIALVDKRLYKAKNSGRNRIV